MKLTSRSEYALIALIYIARHGGQRNISVQEIAEKKRIPLSFLQQILMELRQARILRSSKGKRGGFCLARPAKQISLAEVVRLFDGPLAPIESASKNFYQHTPIETEKRLFGVFLDIRNYIASKMERTTLAQVANI